MSLIKANAVQVGQSPTATQNFTLAVPSSPDGTIKLARGNAGATTQDVLSVDASGNINGLVKSTGSTTARSLANRFGNIALVEDFGAVGDGITDDSAAFQAGLTAKRTIHLDGSKQYVVKNVDLSNSHTIIGNGAIIKSAAGASYLFKLKDFSPHIQDIYVSECTASDAAIVFGGSRFASINNIRILNCSSAGILFKTNVLNSDTLSSVSKSQLSNIHVEGFQTCGLDVRSNVNEINAVNVYLDSGLNAPFNQPKANAFGVRVVSTGSTAAYGGHLFVNVTTINSQWGWHFTDAELTKLDSCIADGHSSDGISLNGNCQYFDIADTFIGTCGRSINVSGTSSNNSLSGIRSIFAGLIPPWGVAPFFTYSAPFYDLAVNNTATVSVDTDAWFGNINSFAATNSSINWIGGDKFDLISTSNVTAGSTVYFGPAGQFTTVNNALWVASTACRIVGFYVATALAPSAGESFTYTIVVNGVDTAMTATSSGASSFSVQNFTSSSIFVSKNDTITLKVVTSSGAAATNHRGYIITVPST
jgi:hypothetical protein